MQGSAFHPHLLRIITRRLQPACCLVLLTIALRGHGADVPNPIQVAPPGTWVKPNFFNQQASTALLESSADEHLLLWEQQINAQKDETFRHSVRQILTSAGVQNGATIKIDFNPGYQSLTWHWARIWRDGQHLDRLDTNQVKVVQQEKDVDQFILNGEKSAILVLNDIRVGDIIDCAYSLSGTNPVFGPHFSAEIPVQMDQPAERLLTRVVWPAKRRLYAKPHGCSVQPSVISGSNTVEYTWDVRQAPGIGLEDLMPAWCDPQPWVQLSEFKTWADVNQWACSLFQVTNAFSPELAKRVAEWKQVAGPEQQILAVLRFVQDDVRYFGIEIGASAETPTDPSVVFARRFGDCKDKSLLFVTILRALGIEAYPVLVNAIQGRAIMDWQPTDGAFDHCIAVVQCDGQTYWLDPTMNYQRGTLAAHFLPSYDCGLIIAPHTTALTPIPQKTGMPETATTEYFQLGHTAEPGQLRVVTVAVGRDADGLREIFASTKRSDIEKSYTHFYSDLYPGIRMSSPITLEDDEQQNRVQTTEYYSIENAWTQADKTKKLRCDFYPSIMAAFLKKPVDVDRKLPLGIGFPRHQILRTEVTVPEILAAESIDKSVDDPAFTFRKTSRTSGTKLVTEYEYQSLADSVSADRVGEYVQRLNQTSQLLGDAVSLR